MSADPLFPLALGDRRLRRVQAVWRRWRARAARALEPLGAGAGGFVWHAVVRGRMVGAVAPSSRRLARAMAAAADGADRIVELGAGTGAVTSALVERHAGRPLSACEIDPEWAAALRRRFPAVPVCALPADQALAQLVLPPCDKVVLVSSLPFRSLPEPWHGRTRQAIEAFLLADPRRRLVQYTYQPRAPFTPLHTDRLVWHCRSTVWGNMPPAWVWELRRPDSEAG